LYHLHQFALVRLLPAFSFALPLIMFRLSKFSPHHTARPALPHGMTWSCTPYSKLQPEDWPF
jgi:hypothetical protein